MNEHLPSLITPEINYYPGISGYRTGWTNVGKTRAWNTRYFAASWSLDQSNFLIRISRKRRSLRPVKGLKRKVVRLGDISGYWLMVFLVCPLCKKAKTQVLQGGWSYRKMQEKDVIGMSPIIKGSPSRQRKMELWEWFRVLKVSILFLPLFWLSRELR